MQDVVFGREYRDKDGERLAKYLIPDIFMKIQIKISGICVFPMDAGGAERFWPEESGEFQTGLTNFVHQIREVSRLSYTLITPRFRNAAFGTRYHNRKEAVHIFAAGLLSEVRGFPQRCFLRTGSHSL